MFEQIWNFLKENALISKGLLTLAILFVTFILSRVIPKLEHLIIRRLTGKTETDLDDAIIRVLGGGSRKVVWLAGFYFVVQVMETIVSESVTRYAKGFLYVLLVFIIANILSSVLKLLLDWYSERWGKRVKGQFRDEFGPLFKRLITIVVYTIAIVFVLRYFKQDISSIIVSLGVGSLAVALAAKDTLANMIAGFMIMTDRPFRKGDRILLESGEKGDVYDIGLRSTKILTFDNTLIVVPNQQIINEKVTNLSYPDPQIRVSIEVGVAYGSDLRRVKGMLLEICNEHTEVLETPPPAAYFTNFGDSSLDLKVVCRVARWDHQWRVGEDLRMAIYEKFEKENIEIPFPQRVVTMQNHPSKPLSD
jgi:MscS family membrane protein